MIPKDIIEKEIASKLKVKPEKASMVNAVLQIVITGDNGGTWTIDCTKQGGEVKEGKASSPKLTVTMDSADFCNMFEGSLSPQKAFLTGKVKVDGDMSLALKLGNILA